MPMGFMPLTASWTLSRLQVVVLPEEEGPAMSTSLTPLLLPMPREAGGLMRWVISSAILLIFFSCSASLI